MSQVVEDNVILPWAAAGLQLGFFGSEADTLRKHIAQPIHIHQMDGKWMAGQEIEEEAANAKWPKTKLHTVRT